MNTRVALGIAFLAVCGTYLLSEVVPQLGRAEAAPRPVVPRGELTAEEKSNISIFESSKVAVVYISTLERVMDVWTRNVMTVPRGTGSGFIWDDAGHVVTNLHVITGAAEANVRLSDGRDSRPRSLAAAPRMTLQCCVFVSRRIGPHRSRWE